MVAKVRGLGLLVLKVEECHELLSAAALEVRQDLDFRLASSRASRKNKALPTPWF